MLGVGGIVITAAVLVGVGAVASDRFGRQAEQSVDELTQTDLGHVTEGVTRLATAVGDGAQAMVDRAQNVAITALRDEGGMTFARETASWQATNQLTQEVTPVTLPRVNVGSRWLGQNREPTVGTPVVDHIRDMV